MPMLTTALMGRLVCPVQVPARTASAKTAMRSSTAWTSGITSTPSTTRCASRGARRAVCNTARSSVTFDAITSEHRVAVFAEPGLLREFDEEADGLVGQAVPGIVQEEARTLPGHALATGRIGSEEVAQVLAAHHRVMALKGQPRGATAQWLCSHAPSLAHDALTSSRLLASRRSSN